MTRLWIGLAGVLLAAVLASAIAVVWARHQSRSLFVQLTQLQNVRDALNVDFGRMELEQSTWADPARVERVARQDLGLIDPPPDSIRLIRP